MERQDRGDYTWKSCQELGAGPEAEKAIAEAIRAKVRYGPTDVVAVLLQPAHTHTHTLSPRSLADLTT